jgi:hypothetical protein
MIRFNDPRHWAITATTSMAIEWTIPKVIA